MRTMHEARAEHGHKAHKLLSRTGYARGGALSAHGDDDARDKDVVRAVHEHEAHLHKGEHETKLKHGGKVEGEPTCAHLGKRARGGRAGKRGTKVNVIVAPQVHDTPAVAAPHLGAPAMAAPHPPVAPRAPMMAPHPGAGMPMRPGMGAAMPMRPPGVMKRGGGVKMKAGAGGAEGREEKIKDYGARAR